MSFVGQKLLQKLGRLMFTPGLEPAQRSNLIHTVERDIILPIKLLIILTLVYYFYFSNWFGETSTARTVAFETIRQGFLVYIVLNLAVGAVFVFVRNLPLNLIQWTIYTMGLLDALLFAALSFVTDGFDSTVFWIFPALILRNAISIPLATPQIVLNFMVTGCYILAGVLDVAVSHEEADQVQKYMDWSTRSALSIGTMENPAEPFLMRIVILVLWTFCCYGLQTLLEKHRRAIDEAVEFATRQEQLQTAGRLAAEIAHRIKNPLSIINNSAFSLERSLREGKKSAAEQIEIIREEVEKADRILTELMGYAQLAEGRVEKLNVIEELEKALNEVLPAAAKYPIRVVRNYAPGLPHLMMQRGHLAEIFVNLLKNAREAMDGSGEIKVSVQHGPGYSVLVKISDTGPGIPPDKQERIFEAYFSTKEKGTGLGLPIVRHNIEIYGGKIRVESGLGQGATFILQFPVKTVMKFSK
jgi:signal transduction histidine kinase